MTIINEITIQDKFNKETENGKNKLPFEIFDKLCRLDPTLRGDNVGKFTNWILSKYYEDADIDTLKKRFLHMAMRINEEFYLVMVFQQILIHLKHIMN